MLPIFLLLSFLSSVCSDHLTENVFNGHIDVLPPVTYRNASYISIGGLFSMSVDGKTSLSKGIHRAEAFKCATKLLNEQQIIPDATLLWYLQDDYQIASTGLAQSLAFIQQGLTAVVGAGPSAVSEPVARLLSGFKIPLVSYASTLATLADRTLYTTFFRTVASDNAQVETMIATAQAFKWTLIAAAGSNDNYGAGGLNNFVNGSKEAKIIVGCEYIILTADPAGEETQKFAECIRSTGANVVMLFMNEVLASAVLSVLNETKTLTKSMTFLASDSWATPDFMVYANSHYNDSFHSSVMKGSLGFIQQPGDMTWFQKCFGELNPSNTDYSLFRDFWETRFTCKLNEDLPLCTEPRTTSHPCQCTGEETLADDPPNTKVSFVYDSLYAIANVIRTIRDDCSAIKSKDLCTVDPITNEHIQYALQELEFTGKTGKVSFDGAERAGNRFDVIQYDGTDWKTVGTFDGETGKGLSLQWDSLTWKTPNNEPPVSEVQVKYVDHSDGVAIAVETISSLLIFLAILTAVLFTIHHKSPVVRRSSYLFCNLILFGLITVWVSLYLWAGEPTDSTCIAKIWLGLLGFSIVMGNLLAKTYRVWKIFNQKTLKVVLISDQELLLYSGAIILVEVILLGILMRDAPRVKVMISTDNELDQYNECKSDDEDFQTIMIWIFFGYNLFLVAFGSYMAYLTRGVVSHFNESRYIALSMYNITVCLAVVAPIYFTVGDASGKDKREYVIRSAASLLASGITYFALFAPKIHALLVGTEDVQTTATAHTTKQSA